MADIIATSNYQNWQFIVDDTFALAEFISATNFSDLIYALSDYPNWQVLTTTTLYQMNAISQNRLSTAFNIRFTRPLVLADVKEMNISVEGLFSDDIRYKFYDNLTDALIKPEDGKEEIKNPSTEVENNGTCNG